MKRRRRRGGRRWSAEGVVEALREVVAQRGRGVRLGEFCHAARISQYAVGQLFGNWTRLRRAAGLPERRRWTRETLVQRLREEVLGRKLDVDVSLWEFCRAVGVSPTTVQNVMGGWMALREEAGLRGVQRRRRGRHTRESVREALMHLAEVSPGGRVTGTQFERETGIALRTVQILWGSWTELQRATGVKRNRTRRTQWTEEALLAEYHRVVQMLEKIPTRDEFNQHGRCSARTVHVRFGGKWELRRAYRDYLLGLKQRREAGIG